MKKVVVIDNYDSFTYNLVHYLEDLNAEITVYRNDEFDIEELEIFDKIVLSPGPGLPDDAGLLKAVITRYYQNKSILGICLGMQAIGEIFNCDLINLKSVFHGVSSKVKVIDEKEIIFEGLPNNFSVGRYHSWVINPEILNNDLIITSIDNENQIMSIRHKKFDVCGVQFHPESILTEHGKMILKNWLNN